MCWDFRRATSSCGTSCGWYFLPIFSHLCLCLSKKLNYHHIHMCRKRHSIVCFEINAECQLLLRALMDVLMSWARTQLVESSPVPRHVPECLLSKHSYKHHLIYPFSSSSVNNGSVTSVRRRGKISPTCTFFMATMTCSGVSRNPSHITPLPLGRP